MWNVFAMPDVVSRIELEFWSESLEDIELGISSRVRCHKTSSPPFSKFSRRNPESLYILNARGPNRASFHKYQHSFGSKNISPLNQSFHFETQSISKHQKAVILFLLLTFLGDLFSTRVPFPSSAQHETRTPHPSRAVPHSHIPRYWAHLKTLGLRLRSCRRLAVCSRQRSKRFFNFSRWVKSSKQHGRCGASCTDYAQKALVVTLCRVLSFSVRPVSPADSVPSGCIILL